MNKELKRFIDSIAIVDNHAHVGATLAQDEMAYPDDEKPVFRDAFMTPEMISFGFPALRSAHAEAFERIYGFPAGELEDFSKYDKFAEEYERRRLAVAETAELCMSEANVEHIINVNYTPKALEGHKQFSFIPLIDPLLFPFGGRTAKPSGREFMCMFEYLFGVLKKEYSLPDAATYSEYMDFVSRALDGFAEKGFVRYKFICAYVRDLRFIKPAEPGETLYIRAAEGNDECYVKLQNHIACAIIARAAREGTPIQLHTALIDEHYTDADPLGLSGLLLDEDTKDAKLVLLHAGYPLFDHARTMALAAGPISPNGVYLDISGRLMFAHPPAFIAKLLSSLLDYPALWGKILYGSDAMLGERYIHVCAQNAREAIYRALTEKLTKAQLI